MPEARTTPSRQRRARTGCLSCRRRRRKCDETKPACLNCQARNVACIYPGADLKFPAYGVSQTDDEGATKPPSGYKAFTFVNQNVSIAGPEGSTYQSLPDTSAPATHDDQLDIRESLLAESPEGARNEADQIVELRIHRDRRSKSTSINLDPVAAESPGLNTKSSIQHFCYITAPWIEAGNTKALFANQVMRLAQDRPAIMSAILAFSSAPADRNNGIETSSFLGWSGLHQGRSGSVDLEGTAQRIYGGLVTINSFLKCSTRKWPSLRPSIMTETEGIGRLSDEPLCAIARMHSRLDLATSVLNGLAPLTSPSFYRGATSPTATRTTELPEVAQNQCLGYLTTCLHLIHGNAQAVGQTANHHQTSDVVGSSFSSQWASLWSDTQTWFKTRSLTMQPILDVRSIEASKLDPSHSSSFPIQIYTNVAALQANVVYHLSSILLLARKPRLLKLTSTEQQFVTSQGWHAQQIAGAAMSNEFAEQWDPIFIVALLHIAKSMTHPAQQQALVSRFHRIAASTGIPMDEDIDRLQAEWDAVRSGGAADGI